MYHAFALASRVSWKQRLAMRIHLRRRGLAAVLLFSIVGVGPGLAAQSPATGTIAGTVTDSVHSKPAVGAMVLLTRLAPEPSEFRSAITDDKGRFRFDTLVAGRYAVAFATAYLDSLGLTFPPREVVLATGQAARADFATPSGATLRAAACPGINLARGRGAVVGQVTDADTERPLAGAHVAVSWTELSVDSVFHPVTTSHGGEVAVDSLGRYRLCGVPTDTYLMVQVQDSGRAGSVLTMTVDDDGGVLVRDLSLSAESAQSIASLDSAAAAAARDTMSTPKLLTGTATVSGIVLGPGGRPLSDAQLRVIGAVGVVRTDSTGRFTLSEQPAGSQLLETRRVGYLLSRTPIELRSRKSVETTVTLTRVVNLDSIRVIARRNRYTEFERARKGGFGRYLDESEIEKRHPLVTSDLFRTIPGFRIQGFGLDAQVVSTRGAISFRQGGCPTNVVIDGIQHQEINLLDPSDIGAIEAYPGPAGAPMQYDSACGVVVIWTKR
jgi:hypothetical protein